MMTPDVSSAKRHRREQRIYMCVYKKRKTNETTFRNAIDVNENCEKCHIIADVGLACVRFEPYRSNRLDDRTAATSLSCFLMLASNAFFALSAASPYKMIAHEKLNKNEINAVAAIVNHINGTTLDP